MRAVCAHILALIGASTLLACSPAGDQSNAPVNVPANIDAATKPVIPSLEASITQNLPNQTVLVAPQVIDDIDFGQYSRELASFSDLRQGQSRIAAIDVVRLLFAPDDGAKIIKTSSANFALEGGSVMLLSAAELPDDSVRAQEFYLIFEGNGNAQILADYGLRVKCYRGENITDWQMKACP